MLLPTSPLGRRRQSDGLDRLGGLVGSQCSCPEAVGIRTELSCVSPSLHRSPSAHGCPRSIIPGCDDRRLVEVLQGQPRWIRSRVLSRSNPGPSTWLVCICSSHSMSTTDGEHRLGIVTIVCRMISRRIARQSWKGLQVDDYMMMVVAVSFTGVIVCVNETAIHGSNYLPAREAEQLTDSARQSAIWGSKMTFALEHFTLTSLWMVKGCLLILYSRLTYVWSNNPSA